MNADLAKASVAAEKFPGHNRVSQTVVLEPTYGQLDYYAPVLLKMGQEYGDTTAQHLALWDQSMGQMQNSRYITPDPGKIPPDGIQMRFEMGGYCYLWYDDKVPTTPGDDPLSYHFASIGEAYARGSWDLGDIVVGIDKGGRLVVHAGGRPVLIWSAQRPVTSVEDNGSVATITAGSGSDLLTIELFRDQGRLVIRRQAPGDWSWWMQGEPSRDGDTITWGDKVRLTAVGGSISGWDPTGNSQEIWTGMGRLRCNDPAPKKFPLVTVTPKSGETVVEIKLLAATKAVVK